MDRAEQWPRHTGSPHLAERGPDTGPQKSGPSLNLRPHARGQPVTGVMRHGPEGGNTSRWLSGGPPERGRPAQRHRGHLRAQARPTLQRRPPCEASPRGHRVTVGEEPQSDGRPELPWNLQPAGIHPKPAPDERSEHSALGNQHSSVASSPQKPKPRATTELLC